jgi:virginiamycin B lyase
MRALAIRVYGMLFAASALAMDAHVVVHQFAAPNAGGTIRMGSTNDGDIWFAQPNANSLARIEPDGTITERLLPVAESRPLAIARGETGGRLAFTLVDTNRIGLMDANGVVAEFAIPTPDSDPRGIGVSTLAWFTEYDGNRIGRLDPGAAIPIQEFLIPTPNSGPLGIAPGPGAIGGTTDMWFTEYLANKIGRIDAAGVITEYSIPTANSGPTAIVEGVFDGQPVMYFTEATANKIGKITPAGHITEFPIPTPSSSPNDIVYDWRYGGVWFTQPSAARIGWLSERGKFREFKLPGGSRPDGIALGYVGDHDQPWSVWYVDGTRRRVGRLSDNRIIAVGAGHGLTWDTEFQVSNLGAEPARARLAAPQVGVCPALCPGTYFEFDIPRDDTVEVAASDGPFSEGSQALFLDTFDPEINDVPETRAWIVDVDRPDLRVDLPLVDYWAVAAMMPPLPSGTNGPRPFLEFPARRTAGVRTDLLLVALATDGSQSLSVLLEALDTEGEVVAEMPLELPALQLVVLDKILTELEIFGDFEGHLRVKRNDRSGFFWGAAEIIEGGQLTRVMAPGSELEPGRCQGDLPRCSARPQPRVVPRASVETP